MFPHTITIYHHDIIDNTEKYTRQIVTGVYVQEQYGITKSGHGQQNNRSITVTTSKRLADSFDESWSICDGDKIIVGIGDEITKFSDIPKAYTVTNIIKNQCGCDVDNIVVMGV